MRNRHQALPTLKISRDLIIAGVLLLLSGLMVVYVPPIHIALIFLLTFLFSTSIFLILKQVISFRAALLLSVGICLGLFLYGIDMLDFIHTILLISLLASVGALVYQR